MIDFFGYFCWLWHWYFYSCWLCDFNLRSQSHTLSPSSFYYCLSVVFLSLQKIRVMWYIVHIFIAQANIYYYTKSMDLYLLWTMCPRHFSFEFKYQNFTKITSSWSLHISLHPLTLPLFHYFTTNTRGLFCE